MLIVDDDAGIRAALRRGLELEGFAARDVADGAAALFDRFTERGLQIMIRDQGELRPATPAE